VLGGDGRVGIEPILRHLGPRVSPATPPLELAERVIVCCFDGLFPGHDTAPVRNYANS